MQSNGFHYHIFTYIKFTFEIYIFYLLSVTLLVSMLDGPVLAAVCNAVILKGMLVSLCCDDLGSFAVSCRNSVSRF